MKEAFLYVLKDYLSIKQTDYALMINGAWGSGKTYFIEHEVKKIIESVSLPKQKPSEDKKYKCVLVSLYGVSSSHDISDAVLFSMKPELKWIKFIFGRAISAFGFIPKFGQTIKDIFSLNRKEKDEIDQLFSSFKEHVIVFDDLERIDKSLDIQSVLGYINHLAERDKCKIIVVANDDVLSEDYKCFKALLSGEILP